MTTPQLKSWARKQCSTTSKNAAASRGLFELAGPYRNFELRMLRSACRQLEDGNIGYLLAHYGRGGSNGYYIWRDSAGVQWPIRHDILAIDKPKPPQPTNGKPQL